jgi:Raf kinase inhibitor-like YbhB/YbcL family protein
MKITSDAFENGEAIPNEFTMYGENKVPPLHLDEVPEKARSLALLVDDPDAPRGTFTHWILFNLAPESQDIDENHVPASVRQGRNDFGKQSYCGPKPPSGEHRYFFKAFALDTELSLPAGAQRQEFEKAIQGHVLDSASLMGRYAH